MSQVSELDVILTSMVCEMENDNVEEMDIEGLSSMWPEDINDAGKQLHIEKPGAGQDMLEEIIITEEPKAVDFKRLVELTDYSEKGSSQLSFLVKNWEYRQANAVRLLREELDNLSKQKQEVELKHLEILEEHRFEGDSYGCKRPISILDEVYDILPDFSRKIKDLVVANKGLEIEVEYDTVIYWKQRARHLEELLEAGIQREQILMEKLQESIKSLERQSSPVEELSQILKRADHYLHFILQTAPVVMGHQVIYATCHMTHITSVCCFASVYEAWVLLKPCLTCNHNTPGTSTSHAASARNCIRDVCTNIFLCIFLCTLTDPQCKSKLYPINIELIF